MNVEEKKIEIIRGNLTGIADVMANVNRQNKYKSTAFCYGYRGSLKKCTSKKNTDYWLKMWTRRELEITGGAV